MSFAFILIECQIVELNKGSKLKISFASNSVFEKVWVKIWTFK